MKLWFVAATRLAEAAFHRDAPLARSLKRAEAYSPFVLAAAYENQRPLADVYNRAIDMAKPDDVLVFVHDDVWVDDWHVAQRLRDALDAYDVVGVAGNRVRAPRQASWVFDGDRPRADQPTLSGGIQHGAPGAPVPSRYGDAPAEVRLLDGVFLAARAATLRDAGVRFDARFPFHFYDTDFCRACEQAGLRLGTWPIALTHASSGENWAGEAWEAAYRVYLDKWGD
ncbi:MAG TPA: glycosyltransferase [Casimicrobiaceae bacterium]